MKRLMKLRYILVGSVLLLLIVLGLCLQDDYRKNGKFRTMQDPLLSSEKINLTGLKDLKIAAGPILSMEDLQKKFSHIKGEKIIVDGTNSKHNYVNGIPTSYLGYHRSTPTWKDYFWRVYYTGTLKVLHGSIISEALEAKKYGFGYKNLHIASKYISSDADVDEFISFIEKLPENVWLYFHCNHGKGRTSIMLVMADIMKNAPQVPLEDIVRRQYLLGSVDLFDTTPWSRGTYAQRTLEERKKFIMDFYAFVCQKKAGGIPLWSDWNRHRHKVKAG